MKKYGLGAFTSWVSTVQSRICSRESSLDTSCSGLHSGHLSWASLCRGYPPGNPGSPGSPFSPVGQLGHKMFDLFDRTMLREDVK